jgi:ElaA protein
MPLTWKCLAFHELDTDLLYAILRIRQEVFIMEQQCFYLDADGVDLRSLHLLALDEDGHIAAYARIIPPGIAYCETSFGRVLVPKQLRGNGIGQELTSKCIAWAQEYFGRMPIRISAQLHLVDFYQQFGFETDGSQYLDAGLPHIQMVLPAVTAASPEDFRD